MLAVVGFIAAMLIVSVSQRGSRQAGGTKTSVSSTTNAVTLEGHADIKFPERN